MRPVDMTRTRRMRKQAVQQGRSKRRGEIVLGPYGEPLSAARTPLADCFRILLVQRQKSRRLDVHVRAADSPLRIFADE